MGFAERKLAFPSAKLLALPGFLAVRNPSLGLELGVALGREAALECVTDVHLPRIWGICEHDEVIVTSSSLPLEPAQAYGDLSP